MTLKEKLKELFIDFENANIDGSDVCAREIISFATNIEKKKMFGEYSRILTSEESEKINKYKLNLLSGEPLQYVVGSSDFYNLKLEVNPSVLIPRPETEELVDIAVKKIESNSQDFSAIDLCSGSGAIGLAIAKKFPNAKIDLLEYSKEALELSRKNAKLNNISNVEFIEADILQYKLNKRYDYVFSNPPYIPLNEWRELESQVREKEPKIALTDDKDGLEFYRRFAAIFPEIIRSEGLFFLELGWDQSENIKDIFFSICVELDVIEDFAEINRYAIGKII